MEEVETVFSESNQDETNLKTTLRRRKAALYRLVEKQRVHLREGGKHLIWKRKTEQSIKYDVVIIFAPKGYHIMEPIAQLINEYLPQLMVEKKAHSNKNEEAFYITAHHQCLVETGNLMGFHNTDGSIPSRQRQTIIKYYLDSLRWCKENQKSDSIEKLMNVKLIEGEAIISKLIKLKYIKQVLPLHCGSDLNRLRETWVSAVFSPQPLKDICNYFGVKIALYFAFVGYYTCALLAPAIFGILITVYSQRQLISDACIIIFSLFIIFWSSFYLHCWNGYQTQLAKEFGHLDCDLKLYSLRPQFHGETVFNSQTGQFSVYYPEWKRKLFFYLVTIPVIASSLFLVFFVMIQTLHLQTWWDTVLIGSKSYPHWTSYFPKVLLACMINIMDSLYRRIAVWLTNRENYEHDDVHDNQLIIKLVLFQFVNSFLCLFYIAFYTSDMAKLKEQLAALLITRQVIGNIKESIWPFLRQSYRVSLAKEDTSQAELESALYCYESTFEDYLEMFIQFGYVTLFSAAFPLAAFCALINNIIEIRSDAFKLCVTYQRPFSPGCVKNIGVWQSLFNCMVYISIIVNCCLIGKSGQLSRIFPLTNEVHLCIACVVLEHIMIALKFISERTDVSTFLKNLLSFSDRKVSLGDPCDTHYKES